MLPTNLPVVNSQLDYDLRTCEWISITGTKKFKLLYHAGTLILPLYPWDTQQCDELQQLKFFLRTVPLRKVVFSTQKTYHYCIFIRTFAVPSTYLRRTNFIEFTTGINRNTSFCCSCFSLFAVLFAASYCCFFHCLFIVVALYRRCAHLLVLLVILFAFSSLHCFLSLFLLLSSCCSH